MFPVRPEDWKRGGMDLKVPYAEKDEAKALGALWDSSRLCWYVPTGLDPRPFQRWIPPRDTGTPGLNLRALEAYVVTAPRRCWRCTQPTIVVGFLMAPGFEDFSLWEEEIDGEGRWGGGQGWAFAHDIDTLPSLIAAQAITRAPFYRRAFSSTTQSHYWANHCSECRALQGDFHLFEEPDGPFLLLEPQDIVGHRAFRLQGAFEASGSFGYAVDVATEIPGVRGGSPANAAPRPPAKARSTAGGGPIRRILRRWLGQA
jgi:hypothetical protein